ncbi:S8 family serine peptidase [Thiotrichales bacterium 19S3-7]|nr:S8 family serine peptidase [Thiotrichales bacterium 19S3-7]MCF6802981.1 S8 family serine peptidase [Thiotrichales bacterium 19S3-11]
MKKLLASTITSILCLSATGFASDLSFTVKLKNNANINSINSLNTSNLESIAKLTNIQKQNNQYVFVFKTDDNAQSIAINDANMQDADNFHKAMEITRALQKDDSIEYAVYRGVKMKAIGYKSPNLMVKTDTTSGDGSRWNEQWDMHGKYSVHAYSAWNILKNKQLSDVTVAITDTGIAANAPNDINNHVIRGLYFSQSGSDPVTFTTDPTDNGPGSGFHGTHVAGTIGAQGPVVYGVTAKWPSSIKLVAVKVLGDNGSGSFDAVDAGVEWAVGAKPGYDMIPSSAPGNVNPAQVVNLSLGAQKQPWTSDQDWNTFAQEYCKKWQYVVVAAHQHNATLVIAAGNGNFYGPTDVADSLPAGCTNGNSVIVSATGPEGKMAFYSNTTNNPKTLGNNVAVKAPGGNDSSYNDTAKQILSTINNGYGFMQGTSMATPHVVGVAALIYAVNGGSNYSYKDVQTKLEESTTDGILDASKAIQ